jgi:cell division initiation protein
MSPGDDPPSSTGSGPVEQDDGRGRRKLEISPLDVRSQVFRRKFKGCDPDEVKQFLDAVADRMETILKAKEEFEKENAALREKISAYSKMEQTLRDTLLTAQRVSADSRSNAEHSAQNIIKEAELEAKKRVISASSQVDSISKNRDVLRAETMALAAKLKSLIEAQITFIDGMEEEITNIGTHAPKVSHAVGGDK